MSDVEKSNLKETILRGAKAAREIGKSRPRTFEIGDGLLALRAQCLIDMGRSPLVNDRSVLKSGKYRELMGRALKTYPDYTLSTVFKNDSTRLAYMFVAEHRADIERVFAEAEVSNPGSTLRIVNPERIKSKYKSLTEPPKRKKEKAAAIAAEAIAQENDELFRKLKEDAINTRRQYDDLFARFIDFDETPADRLAELLLDVKAKNQGNRLRFIDLIVKYATGAEIPTGGEPEHSPEFVEAVFKQVRKERAAESSTSSPETEGKPSGLGKSPRRRRAAKPHDDAAPRESDEAAPVHVAANEKVQAKVRKALRKAKRKAKVETEPLDNLNA